MPVLFQKALERLFRLMIFLRSLRAITFFVAWLRIAIGFAFLPAGLKKILGQPFTDPSYQGRFHEFLHAFHATGFFYKFVGGVQLVAAILLITNTWPLLGGLILFPVVSAILVFCWSTGVYPTATVVTLIFCGLLFLLAWETNVWAHLVPRIAVKNKIPEKVNRKYWRNCGLCIVTLYFLDFVRRGNVYRPRHPEWNDLSFILLVLMALLPFLTMGLEVIRTRENSS